MTCQSCGKGCKSRSEGRRLVQAGRVLFLCNVCTPAVEAAVTARKAVEPATMVEDRPPAPEEPPPPRRRRSSNRLYTDRPAAIYSPADETLQTGRSHAHPRRRQGRPAVMGETGCPCNFMGAIRRRPPARPGSTAGAFPAWTVCVPWRSSSCCSLTWSSPAAAGRRSAPSTAAAASWASRSFSSSAASSSPRSCCARSGAPAGSACAASTGAACCGSSRYTSCFSRSSASSRRASVPAWTGAPGSRWEPTPSTSSPVNFRRRSLTSGRCLSRSISICFGRS